MLKECVGETFIADVTGQDQGFLPGGAGDGGGSGVVAACFSVGVTVGGVSEFGEDPGNEDFSESGLVQIDFTSGCRPKWVITCSSTASIWRLISVRMDARARVDVP